MNGTPTKLLRTWYPLYNDLLLLTFLLIGTYLLSQGTITPIKIKRSPYHFDTGSHNSLFRDLSEL